MSSIAAPDSSPSIISSDQAATLASKGAGKLAGKLGFGKKKSAFLSKVAGKGAKYVAPMLKKTIAKAAGFKRGGRVKHRLPKRTKSGRFMKRGGRARK